MLVEVDKYSVSDNNVPITTLLENLVQVKEMNAVESFVYGAVPPYLTVLFGPDQTNCHD